MNLSVHGKQMDLGDALHTHVEEKLEDINSKYFNRAIDATVTFAPEGHSFVKTHISIRIGKDIMVMSDSQGTDAYVAFDTAADKVAKQLRRYKRRLRDHHEKMSRADNLTPARNYTIESVDAANDDDVQETQGEDPAVIAEMETHIHTMSVCDAVMRLDLLGENALLFRNAKTKAINMVYRRSDGNIGWVDPQDQ
jgi:ribosomal subunit interface protein